MPRVCSELMGISVTRVACGAKHCAAVSDLGGLYTWGDGECGQLGHGDKRSLKMRRPVMFARRAGGGDARTLRGGGVQCAVRGYKGVECAGVACGRAHTIAVDRDGVLYAFGSDNFGQCGLGPRPRPAGTRGDGGDDADDDADCVLDPRDAMGCVTSPTALAPPPVTPVTSVTAAADARPAWSVVACGEAHSVALTTRGVPFSWGSAEDGRLGVCTEASWPAARAETVVCAPRCVTLGAAPAVMVDTGDAFTAFVDRDGGLWGCGANWRGQLGLDPSIDEVITPTPLLAHVGEGVMSVACGADHMAAIDYSGRLWTWGGHGVNGGGTTSGTTSVPTRVELPADDVDDAAHGDGAACVLVACGAGVTIAVSDGGGAYTWGNGRGGRLGLADGELSHDTPQRLEALSTPSVRVMAVACGKGVSAGLDEAPAVLTLAEPEAPEAFSEQFNRFFRESHELG